MEKEKGYNGYTNYETWNYKLWIDNDENSQNYWNDRAIDLYKIALGDDLFSRIDNAAFELKDELKNEIEENQPEVTGVYADLLNSAISEINFYEIALDILNDLKNENELEEEEAEE